MWHVKIERGEVVSGYVADFNNAATYLGDHDHRHMFLRGYDAAILSYSLNQQFDKKGVIDSAKVVTEPLEVIQEEIYGIGCELYEVCGFQIDDSGEFFAELAVMDDEAPGLFTWRLPRIQGGFDTIAIYSDQTIIVSPQEADASLIWEGNPPITHWEINGEAPKELLRWHELAKEFWHLSIKYKEPLEVLWSANAVEV